MLYYNGIAWYYNCNLHNTVMYESRYEYAVVEQGFDPSGGDQRFRVRLVSSSFFCCINVGLVPHAPPEKSDSGAPMKPSLIKQLGGKFFPIAQSKKAAPAVDTDTTSMRARMARCARSKRSRCDVMSVGSRSWCSSNPSKRFSLLVALIATITVEYVQ